MARGRPFLRLTLSLVALFLVAFHLQTINFNYHALMVDGFLPQSLHQNSRQFDSLCSRHRSTIKASITRRCQGPKNTRKGGKNTVRLLVQTDTGANNDSIEEREVMETLWSYVNNLQKARKTKGQTKAVYSLATYLENNTFDNDTVGRIPIKVEFFDDAESPNEAGNDPMLSLVEVLERALIQAIRQAGEANDYRIILRLISGGIAFANEHPVLTPRIFGEALNALSQTQANAAKLKSIWNTMIGNSSNSTSTGSTNLPSFLESPPTAFELNTFLKSMASRGKSKACIDIYQTHCGNKSRYDTNSISSVFIQPDAYTISILMSILTDSISGSQKVSDPVNFAAARNPEKGVRPEPESLQSKLESLTYSTCWQWNTAVEIIGNLYAGSHRQSTYWRNNYVYSSLLKLQDKAQDLCNGKTNASGFHRNGPELTMSILDDMIENDIMPDSVTCTLAIKAMGRTVASKSNVAPTTIVSTDGSGQVTSNNNLAVHFLERMKDNPKLPQPNQYSYSAAIKACARLKDYQTALDLLEEMRFDHCNTKAETSSESQIPPPNTWVYNAALLSLDNKRKNYSKQATKRFRTKETEKLWSQRNKQMGQQERTEVALGLLNQMNEDSELHGLNTKPDTVTYNTILGVGTFPHQFETELATKSASSLIDEMEKENITRDTTTYCNAIDSTVHHDELIDVLRTCLSDPSFTDRKSHMKKTNDITSIFNTGFSTLTTRQSVAKCKEVLSLMFDHNIPANDETLTMLIYAVGKNGKGSALVNFVDLLESRDDQSEGISSSDQEELLESIGIFENANLVDKIPTLSDFHYTQAINICLKENEFTGAYAILSKMRAKGINPSTTCMEGFALAYAQSAMDTTLHEKTHNASSEEKAVSVSLSRASSAYKIAMALVNPRSSTLGRVARACAMTGQWKLCRSLLQSIHNSVLTPKDDGTSSNLSPRLIQTIRGTHSYILRECAKQGSMHAALHYTNDIQEFAKKIRAKSKSESQGSKEKAKFSEILTDEDDIFKNLRTITNTQVSKTNVGMQPNDWMSVIQAASKSGHWRVCFNSLQFLRPYVERTNPLRAESANSKSSDERYNQLTYALYAVTRSLESHSQDAWAVRAIEDWIDWSGRQPRVESVLSVIRVLARKGRVEEIRNVIDMCLRKDLSSSVTKDSNLSYEEMLYVGAVTALHNSGQYDDADEFFMSGIQDKFLPFNFFRENGQFVLDLHGLNVALAHSVVRIALRQQTATLAEEGASSQTDMMIITGKGRNSEFHLRPILRPEVQRMLLEEFYPPLNTISVPGNTGALTVLAQDIEAWQEQQQQQKGIRMLKLASVLRNLSSQERLKRIIAMKLDTESD